MSIARTETFANTIFKPLDIGRTIGLVIAFSLLTALSAQVVIPLPFTPIPITGVTFGVLLTGALLGSRLGAITMIVYLLEGTSGLPFFRSGNSGLHYLLLTPTAGYLLSYPAAAFVTGFLAERGWDKKFLTAAIAMALGSVVIFTSGWAWLAIVTGSARYAFLAGVAPFILGDIIKIALAAAALPSAWKVLRMKSANKE